MTSQSEYSQYRLPDNAIPKHYDLKIKTDLENLTFGGTIIIELDIVKKVESLVLNSAGLYLHDAFIASGTRERKWYRVPWIVTDTTKERAIFHLAKSIHANTKAKLRITYDGHLTESMVGYFLSSWEDSGVKKFYTVSQFAPTGARHAFPCWDEPSLKATYSISMISRADTVNLSNMPVITEEVIGEEKLYGTGQWKVTRFETTPLMSSYIVAFGSGHFAYKESSYCSPLTGKIKPLRVYATRDNISQVQFGLNIAAKVVPLYEQLFDIEYPLPKLDLLVASNYMGALENWGQIIGHTSAFLLNEADASMTAWKTVVGTVSHEIAHQWFGNITTMAWWDNIYLNEGFATWMSTVCLDKLFPEYNSRSEFIIDNLNKALILDGKPSSHPVEMECPDALRSQEIFDTLSYSKAASVLRMLSETIGEEKFMKGVSYYLKKHLYGNTVSKDLWDGISEATGLDVATFMNNWITKTGFPVITVTETKGTIRVHQARFLETGKQDESKDNITWHVPLNILHVASDGDTKIENGLFLKDEEMEFHLDTERPFKLNADNIGFYRVLYSPERLLQIGREAMKTDSIFTLNDRIALINDAFALGKATYAQLSSALDLLMMWRSEFEYLVWVAINTELKTFVRTWSDDERVSGKLAAFSRYLYRPLVDELGFDGRSGETKDVSRLRSLALTALAEADDEQVVAEFIQRYIKYQETGDSSLIPPDLASAIYITTAKHKPEFYDIMENAYTYSKTPTMHQAAIVGMSSTMNAEQIKKTFSFVLNDAIGQDVLFFFRALAVNTAAHKHLATFMMVHYDDFRERFEGTMAFAFLIRIVFDHLTTEAAASQIEDFFKDKDTERIALSIKEALTTIRSSAALVKRSTDELSHWFDEHGPGQFM